MPLPMTKGTVTQFDARRGVGYVRHHRGENAIPFSVRTAEGRAFAQGEPVEFVVRGGMAGVAAHGVRHARATS